MKRLIVLTILLLFVFGCAKNNLYVPPDVCVKDASGNYDSIILQRIPDPASASLLLQLANLEAVKNIAGYTVDEALISLDIIESILSKDITFNGLIDEATKQAGIVNNSYGLELFLISQYVTVLDTPEIVSPCDKALILLHLNKQRQMLKLIK